MKLGFIILAHQDLHRTSQLVRFLAKSGCPVSLHIDGNASLAEVSDLEASLRNVENVVLAKRERCGWGRFSIVQATLNAAEVLLENHPDVTNVFLASGSCLPARPIKQLKAFLARHKGVDFIESVPVGGEKWVKDGVDQERFTLYFPLSWRKHRFAFDRLVDLQRLFKIDRAIPKQISPHMGSQWWCLTTKTLRNIIEDPKRQENDRFFSRAWIPDESYFQSLAQSHSDHVRSESLTFATFDAQGKPFLFYDDHLEELPKTGAFFIRKVWPGAQKLYHNLLTTKRKNFPLSKANEMEFNKIFQEANEIRSNGGEGRFLQGRFPHNGSERSGMSNVDYGVFTGFNGLFEDFPGWVKKTKNLNVFGNIFARNRIVFHKNIALAKGNLSTNLKIRNANPKIFLSNFLWSQRSKKRIAIMYDATDGQKIMPDIARDNRASIVIVKEAWLIPIANSDTKFKGKLMRAQVLQARENRFIKALEKNMDARLTVFSLEEALSAPGLVLQAALQVLEPEKGRKPTGIPQLKNTTKLDALVRKLEKNSVPLAYRPSKKKRKPPKVSIQAVSRPYVVK
jgi:hypothetical protein